MNPAIVAPDGFDIVDVGMEQQLSPDQVSCLEGEGRGSRLREGSEGRSRGRKGRRDGEVVCVYGRQHGSGKEEERGGNSSSTEMCTLELNNFLGSLCVAA